MTVTSTLGNGSPRGNAQVSSTRALVTRLHALSETARGSSDHVIRLWMAQVAEKLLPAFTERFPRDSRVESAIDQAKRAARKRGSVVVDANKGAQEAMRASARDTWDRNPAFLAAWAAFHAASAGEVLGHAGYVAHCWVLSGGTEDELLAMLDDACAELRETA